MSKNGPTTALTVPQLPATGERFVTQNLSEHIQIVYEHLHRYLFTVDLCRGKDVLDIASGEGYGSSLLAQGANTVVGVDVSADAVRFATAKYKRDNLRFLKGDCARIPLAKNSIDVVVSFETIEHILPHDKFMSEVKRVLRPNGLLIISSPDKHEYTDRSGRVNPFHVSELYRTDFLKLLDRYFKKCLPLQQRLVAGSFIASDRHDLSPVVYGTHRGSLQGGTFNEGVHEGLYVVAVCTDGELPSIAAGVFENRFESERIWDWYEQGDRIRREIESMRKAASEQNQAVELLVRQKANLEKTAEELTKQRDRLEAALGEKLQKAIDAGRELRSKLDLLESELAEKTQAVVDLKLQLTDMTARVAERETKLEAIESTRGAAELEKGDFDALSREQKKLKLEISGLREEIIVRETSAAELRAEVRELEASLADVISAKEKEQRENAEEVRTLKDAYSEKQNELAALEQEKAALIQKQKDTEREVVARGEWGVKLDAEIAKLRERLSGQGDELRARSETISRQQEELASTKTALKSLQAVEEDRRKEVQAAEEKLLAATSKCEELAASLAEARSNLQATSEGGQIDLQEATATIEKLSGALSKKSEELDLYAKEHSRILESFQSERAILVAQIEEGRKALDDCLAENRQLEKTFVQNSNRSGAEYASEATQNLRILEMRHLAEKEALLAALEQIKCESAARNAEIVDLRSAHTAEVAQKNQEVDTLRSAVNAGEQLQGALVIERDQLAGALQNATRETLDLKAAMQSVQESLNASETLRAEEALAAAKANETLRHELDEALRRLAELDGDHLRTLEKCTQIEEALSAEHREKELLVAEIQELNAEVEGLKIGLQESQTELATTAEALQAAVAAHRATEALRLKTEGFLESTITRLEANHAAAEAQLVSAQALLNKVLKEGESSLRWGASLDGELKAARVILTERDAAIEAQRNEIVEIANERDLLRDALDQSLAAGAELRQQVDDLTNAFNLLENEAAVSQEAATAQLQTLQNEIAQVIDEKVQVETQNRVLLDQFRSLQTELVNAQTSYKADQERHRSCDAERSEIERKLETQVNHLEASYFAAEKQLVSAQQLLNRVLQEGEASVRQSEALANELSLARQAILEKENAETERTAAIAALESSVSTLLHQRNIITLNHNKVVEELQARIRALETERRQAEESARLAVQEKIAQTEAAQAKLLEERAVLERISGKINRMESSTSWKITMPLRFVRRTFFD